MNELHFHPRHVTSTGQRLWECSRCGALVAADDEDYAMGNHRSEHELAEQQRERLDAVEQLLARMPVPENP